MDYLCQLCDKEIIENESDHKNYIATLRKKDDESLYKKYVINKITLDEVDKILKDYVITHNKKFDIYFSYCELKIHFHNNSTRDLKTFCVHNIEIEKICQSLSYSIEYLESKGYKFQNINQMTISTISERCNMKYEFYTHPPMFPLETKLNTIIARNPQLLDQNTNHLLIRKYSHISLNI